MEKILPHLRIDSYLNFKTFKLESLISLDDKLNLNFISPRHIIINRKVFDHKDVHGQTKI